ncbi:MAG: hypothetical protein IJD82_04725 [Clostridia bacterium]|nr:hypothetical protein [Clostridia bacterium]
MKKLVSMLLCIALLASFCAVVSAEETGVGMGDYAIDVNGTYVAGTEGNGKVFCVDIEWTEMSFTYHAEKAPVWNTADHSYSEAVPAYWEGTATITVTNHSNAKVKATPAYEASEGYEDATVSFGTDVLKLDSAEYSTTPGTIGVTPGGSLPAGTENAKIGTITLTIAEDPDVNQEDYDRLLARLSALYDPIAAGGDSTDQATWSNVQVVLDSEVEQFLDGEGGTQEAANRAYNNCLKSIEELEAKYGI